TSREWSASSERRPCSDRTRMPRNQRPALFLSGFRWLRDCREYLSSETRERAYRSNCLVLDRASLLCPTRDPGTNHGRQRRREQAIKAIIEPIRQESVRTAECAWPALAVA